MKLSPRDQLILGIAAIVLLVAAGVFLLIMPQLNRLGELDNEIKSADTEIQSAKTLLDQRQDAKLAAAATQAQLIELANQMPDTPELPSLIIELQDTANDSGIDFTGIAPQVPATANGYSKLPLSLTISGQWTDIIEFTRRLTKLGRQVRVLSVVVGSAQVGAGGSQSTTETAGLNLITATVQVEAYMLGASTGGGGAPPPPGGN